MSGDFWSRRREAVAAEVEAEERAAAQARTDQDQTDLDALSDEEALAQFDLPDPDTLDTPDAVKDFLSHGLPQRLKTRALRRLWRLNPVLANVDGLVDYGEDYTDAATVIEGMQTAYQVGKGMLAHLEAMAKADAPQQTNAEGDDDEAPSDTVDEETADTTDNPMTLASEAVTDFEPDMVPELAVHDAPDDSPAPPNLNRRMTFQFETVT